MGYLECCHWRGQKLAISEGFRNEAEFKSCPHPNKKYESFPMEKKYVQKQKDVNNLEALQVVWH